MTDSSVPESKIELWTTFFLLRTRKIEQFRTLDDVLRYLDPVDRVILFIFEHRLSTFAEFVEPQTWTYNR